VVGDGLDFQRDSAINAVMNYGIKSLIAALVVGALAGWGLPKLMGPQSFEQCVMDQMVGRNPDLLSMAARLCRLNFPSR
jgi:hypothetical protein